MMEAKVITCSVHRSAIELYEAFWQPERFAEWASGLSAASLKREGDVWRAHGPEGAIWITFTPHNAFGVMDHWIVTATGQTIFVPLRIVANGVGSEVMLTLFRQPDMDEAKFAADGAWVRRDLKTLKRLAEGHSQQV